MGCIAKLRGEEMVCGFPFVSRTSCSDQLQGAGGTITLSILLR